MQANIANPSLANAYARVDRAREHLVALTREIDSFLSSVVYSLSIGPAATGVFTDVGRMPALISILVGEILYNLRSGLDYLVYELAYLDSGQIQEQTQFLIEDREAGWENKRGQKLKQISDSHVERIKDFQPFRGCDWTGTLRDLSNPDKHRTLTVISHRGSVVVSTNATTTNQTLRFAAHDTARPSNRSVTVVFDDGTSVRKILQELTESVPALLDVFKPDFPPDPSA